MISKKNINRLALKIVELENLFVRIEGRLLYKDDVQKTLKDIEREVKGYLEKDENGCKMWNKIIKKYTSSKSTILSGKKRKLAGKAEKGEIEEIEKVIEKILKINVK